MSEVVVLLIARVPPEGRDAYLAYERAVLPLLADYGGVLQRRLCDDSGAVEVHVVAFPSGDALERFRADPRRAAAGPLYDSSGTRAEVLELREAPIAELL